MHYVELLSQEPFPALSWLLPVLFEMSQGWWQVNKDYKWNVRWGYNSLKLIHVFDFLNKCLIELFEWLEYFDKLWHFTDADSQD